MNTGALIFAHNSETLNYLKMSLIAAGLVKKNLNVYSFYPMIATQRVSFSDIENKMTDYKWLIK